MSAFAVVYERSNLPLKPGVFERVMERLKHRGPDGSDVYFADRAALGHWHFWTTPEEAGERQPLVLNGLPFKIVLDGRIDNREELFVKLNITLAEGKSLSDAALILHAYARWGEHCFEHFVGEFALVIFDEERDQLICARDQLGDRTLFYAIHGAQIVIASEPWSVAGADGSAAELNENAAAHYFAFKATQDGQTLFKDVNELLPAHVMLVNASGQRSWRYWQPDPSRKIRGKSNDEYAEGFRTLLEESVRCRMRSAAPIGILMSGGLDSTSVAVLAARMLAPAQLTTISYVFDEFAACDERQYINAVTERWDARSIKILCDDAWPYKDWQDWPHNPNHPEGNAYRLLKERAYRRAHAEGLRVLLTGGFGDHLYGAGGDWLADLLAEGRFLDAWRELKTYIRYAGPRWTFQAGFLHRAARRLLDMLRLGGYLGHRIPLPDWLTPLGYSHISQKVKRWLDPALEQHGGLLGLWASLSCSSEIFNASRHTLELRHPYRDRRLIEYVLALPAYQLYYRGLPKRVLRTAMQGILPEIIRTRVQPTSLEPFFLRGAEREKSVLEACLQNPKSNWPKFVDPGQALKKMNNDDDENLSGNLLPWLCVSYERWYQLLYLSN